jgi:hypothetical protein
MPTGINQTTGRSHRLIDLTGQVFGRLKVKEFVGTKNRIALWLCECECGETTTVQGGSLRNGHTQSCGCFRRERAVAIHTKHGHLRDKKLSPEYAAYHSMHQRSENSSGHHPSYTNIKVCRRWKLFEHFLADMGFRPSNKHSLSRIADAGNYEPGNCVWGTREHQREQKRLKKLLDRKKRCQKQQTHMKVA